MYNFTRLYYITFRVEKVSCSHQFQSIFAFICHAESPMLSLRLSLRLTESLISCIRNRLDFVSVAIQWHVTYLSVKSNISNNVGLTLYAINWCSLVQSYSSEHVRQHSLFIAEFGDCMLNMDRQIKRLFFWKCWVWCFIFRLAVHQHEKVQLWFDQMLNITSPIGNIENYYLMQHWWLLGFRPEASNDNKCLLVLFDCALCFSSLFSHSLTINFFV